MIPPFDAAGTPTTTSQHPASLLMEFYPPGTFLRDQEYAVRSLGMRYMAWWKDRCVTSHSPPFQICYIHTYIHTHPFSSSRLSLSPVWHTLWLIKRWKRVPVGSPIFASLPSFFFSSSFIIHHVEIVFHLFYFILFYFLRSRGKWCVGSDTDLVIFSCGCLENSRRNCSLLFSRHTWIS